MSSIVKQLALVDSPEAFFKVIPTDLRDNIDFRIKLHGHLATDVKAQDAFLSMCKAYVPIAFNTTFMTYDPRTKISPFSPMRKPSERNQPFILRPNQIPAVEKLCWCIDNGRNIGIDKNRGEGASEICIKTFTAKALLDELSHFIVGSRTEELVDKAGDLTTLFAKADSVMDSLPTWWRRQCGYDKKNDRVHRLMRIPYNNSRISGVTTNESFNAGSRGTAILLDEFGRVDIPLAKSIEGSIRDISQCIVYSSTHWLGTEHPFNKALEALDQQKSGRITLMWYENPTENMGLYKTSEPGEYEIIDHGYYKDKDLDNALILSNINQWRVDETRVQFIADGLKGIHSPYRAPWFDWQQSERRGNRRDFVCNVCGVALGASDTPFDHIVLAEIKKKHIRPPDFEGELVFELDFNDRVTDDSGVFVEGRGVKRLKWWGELPYGRPNQRHNYIIASDISYGLGSANSASIIVDVNTGEQIGSWADANTKPEDFADYMVALAYWIGGIDDCYLIWESTGGCGSMFKDRILYQRYSNVYTQRREDSKTRKKTDKYGFDMTSAKVKDMVLGGLGIALSGGLAGKSEYMSLIIRDGELLSELFDYIFREKGAGAVCSSKADLSTDALKRHGDRAVAAALAVLAFKEQHPGDSENAVIKPLHSFAWYEEQKELQKAKDKRLLRRILF